MTTTDLNEVADRLDSKYPGFVDRDNEVLGTYEKQYARWIRKQAKDVYDDAWIIQQRKLLMRVLIYTQLPRTAVHGRSCRIKSVFT